MATDDTSGDAAVGSNNPDSGSALGSPGVTTDEAPRMVLRVAQGADTEPRFAAELRAPRGRRAIDWRPFAEGNANPNPFVVTPLGMAAGLHLEQLAQVQAGLSRGSVLIQAVGSASDSGLQAALYDEAVRAESEELVMNPRLGSFTPMPFPADEDVAGFQEASVANLFDGDDRRYGVTRRRSTVFHLQARNEIGKVVEDVRVAALELLVWMDGARARNVRAGLNAVSPQGAGDAPWIAIKEVLELLEVAATEPDWNRTLVLRMTEAEALTPSQLAFLGEVISDTADVAPSVRFMVSGFPGAIATIENHIARRDAAIRVDLDWKLDPRKRCEVAEYIVALTAESAVPFSLATAERIFDRARGVTSVINRIARASWQNAFERVSREGSTTYSEIERMTAVAESGDETLYRQSKLLEQTTQRIGEDAVRYMAALYELTKRSGEVLHHHDAVIEMMVELTVPNVVSLSDAQLLDIQEEYRDAIDTPTRAALRRDGFTTRSDDGRVGLADPFLGEAMRGKQPPEAGR